MVGVWTVLLVLWIENNEMKEKQMLCTTYNQVVGYLNFFSSDLVFSAVVIKIMIIVIICFRGLKI